MEDVVSQEKLLKKYRKENKKAPAVKLLFELIARHARANHFSKADALREKLFEVDSMALPEIVKSAEIIESAKIAAIDQVHRHVWSDLYEKLTKYSQLTALFYGLGDQPLVHRDAAFRNTEYIDSRQNTRIKHCHAYEK